MRKKVIVLFMFLVVGFCTGYGIVYAGIISGWDEPYNPPAYYDPVKISWEDTNMPTFFYKDLAAQGGTVYDYSRDLRSISFTGDFLDWLKQTIQIFKIKIANSTPWNQSILHDHMQKLDNVQRKNGEINQGDAALAILNSNSFRSSDRYDEAGNTYDRQQQLAALQGIYQNYANSAADAISDRTQVQGEINELMDEAANAEGDMQVQQVNSQMQALVEAQRARRNALLANLAQLQAVENQAEADENLAYYRQVQNAQLIVRDPYHETDREKETYTRPSGKGIAEFK